MVELHELKYENAVELNNDYKNSTKLNQRTQVNNNTKEDDNNNVKPQNITRTNEWIKVSENKKHNEAHDKKIRKEKQQACITGLRDTSVNRCQALSDDDVKEEEGNKNNQSGSTG